VYTGKTARIIMLARPVGQRFLNPLFVGSH
jgi:hypothetical protein